MGNVVLSGCIPSYLVCAAVGLAVNPRFRDAPDVPRDDYEALVHHTREEELDGQMSEGTKGHPPLRSHMFMFKIALSLSIVWFLAQWSYVTSLAHTSVTSSTIIANSSSLFTYAFNVLARTERFTPRKTGGVSLALLGAVLVALADGENDASGNSLWGDAMALFSAVAYAVYTMILAVLAPSDDEVSMTLVLGYLGAVNAVIFLPLLVVLALAPGTRMLEGLTWHVVQLIVARAVFDNLLSELFWARAILLTTATVATVGCSMTIPIAFASDFVLHGKVPDPIAVVGAFLLVVGFFFVSERESARVGGSTTRNDPVTSSNPRN
ncbi:unnamed protein product [Ascophyllum nodosum]